MIALRLIPSSLLLLGLLSGNPDQANAQASDAVTVSLEVLATDPGPTATLHTDDAFALRVRYRSTSAFRLRMQGQAQGKIVPGATHASPRYGPGQGEAIAWLALRQPAQLDRVLLVAEDASNGHVLVSRHLPVQLQWSAADEVPRLDAADWVQNLNNAAQRAIAAEFQPPTPEPDNPWAMVLLPIVFFTVPGYLLLQCLAPWFLPGGWRKAAWAPAWGMAPLLVFVLIASYGFDSNLAPIWLLIACPPSFCYLVVLLLLFWMKRKRIRAV